MEDIDAQRKLNLCGSRICDNATVSSISSRELSGLPCKFKYFGGECPSTMNFVDQFRYFQMCTFFIIKAMLKHFVGAFFFPRLFSSCFWNCIFFCPKCRTSYKLQCTQYTDHSTLSFKIQTCRIFFLFSSCLILTVMGNCPGCVCYFYISVYLCFGQVLHSFESFFLCFLFRFVCVDRFNMSTCV